MGNSCQKQKAVAEPSPGPPPTAAPADTHESTTGTDFTANEIGDVEPSKLKTTVDSPSATLTNTTDDDDATAGDDDPTEVTAAPPPTSEEIDLATFSFRLPFFMAPETATAEAPAAAEAEAAAAAGPCRRPRAGCAS